MANEQGDCCGNCDAFIPGGTDDATGGFCHALPAQVIYKEKTDKIECYFPPMRAIGWCRCWQPKVKQ